MNSQAHFRSHKGFGLSAEELERLGIHSIATILAAGTDIAIVSDLEGMIKDVHFLDPELKNYNLNDWAGKNIRETVTVESASKIDRMMKDASSFGRHGNYQVNHPSDGFPDLPVSYTVIRQENWDHLLLLGDDLRQIMSMQQRLVQTQLDLEAEYRNLQANEARYRTIFQMAPEPMILLDGARKTILDMNSASALTFGVEAIKLQGKPLNDLFKRNAEEPAIDAASEARHSGLPVTFSAKIATSGEPVAVTMTPYREHGNANILMTVAPVNEDLALTAKGHGKSGSGDFHRQGRLMPGTTRLDKLPEPVFTIDLKGQIIRVNEMFLDLTQLPNASMMIGRMANNWIGTSPVDLQVLLSKLKDDDNVRGFTTVVKNHLAGEKKVQLSAAIDRQAGEINIIVSNVSASDNQIAIQKLGRSETGDGFSELVGRVPMKELVRESLDVIEKMCIETALDQTRNNRASAAELLGVSRQSLYIKLRKHGLEDYQPE